MRPRGRAEPLGVAGELGVYVVDSGITQSSRESSLGETPFVAPSRFSHVDDHVYCRFSKKLDVFIEVPLLVTDCIEY